MCLLNMYFTAQTQGFVANVYTVQLLHTRLALPSDYPEVRSQMHDDCCFFRAKCLELWNLDHKAFKKVDGGFSTASNLNHA